ncbi:hypothetical protein M9Y10_000513 [Tritrichomonas musculus]|uniref:B box-type domain-containing protein n=1 Tax=Tritrichomonas musculus TaxID=1915356 RepID=A0ABR2L7I4_9EUKA
MESAQYAIDNDDGFYLSVLPTLNDLLLWGLTFFVDKEFRNYHNMTLTQYSIAKRKPIALDTMLQKMENSNIPYDKIIFPNTSSTSSNLFKLAIIFGTSGPYYDTNDIRCLDTLIQFSQRVNPNFNINLVIQNSESPLITAIKLRNEDAFTLLIRNNADLFYQARIDNNEEDNSNMPIITLFRLYNNKSQLEELFGTFLSDYKNDVIQKCSETKINGKRMPAYLEEIGLHGASDFLISCINGIQPPIPTPIPAPPESQPSQGDDENKQRKSERCHCGNKNIAGHCGLCGVALCPDCVNMEPSYHKCTKA